MTELRASIIVNLAGNVTRQARTFEGALGRLGARGRTAFRGMGGAMQGTLRGLARLGNRWTAMATGAGIVGTTFLLARRAMEVEERMERLGIQAKRSSEDMAALWDSIGEKAKTVNLDPKKLLGAVEQIVEMTGDLGFATDNLENLAAAIQATGAEGEPIGAIAAELEKMDITKPKDVAEALDILNAQGKQGAFTLQNLASLGPRVFAAYSASGRGGLRAVREMGAALQMIRMGTGSSEMAATAFEALMRTLQDADKVKMIQGAGIKLFDPEALKQGRQVLRPINELMAEIIRRTGGKATLLSKVFDAEAIRAFNAAAGEFQRTGKLARLEQFFTVKAGGETAADAERAAKVAQQVVDSIGARLMDKGAKAITPAMQKGAEFVETAMDEGMGAALQKHVVEPAREQYRREGANAVPPEFREKGVIPDLAAWFVAKMRGRDTVRGPEGRLLVENPLQEVPPAAPASAAPQGRVKIEVEAKPGTAARVRKVEGRGLDVGSGIIMQPGH